MSDGFGDFNGYDLQPPVALVSEQIGLIDGLLWQLGQLPNE